MGTVSVAVVCILPVIDRVEGGKVSAQQALVRRYDRS